MVVHVHFKIIYISKPFSAKLHEITPICIFLRTRTPTANFSRFCLTLKAAFIRSAEESSDAIRDSEHIEPFTKILRQIQVNFFFY